jgi:hypothetical protein
MHRWKVGLAPAEPAYRKRRRRALTAERKARRRERGISAELSRSERSVRTATPALIVILMLSLGLWAIVWAAIELALAALGKHKAVFVLRFVAEKFDCRATLVGIAP